MRRMGEGVVRLDAEVAFGLCDNKFHQISVMETLHFVCHLTFKSHNPIQPSTSSIHLQLASSTVPRHAKLPNNLESRNHDHAKGSSRMLLPQNLFED